MKLPKLDFLIVGAPKSGTTSLHRYLAGHPMIFLPEAKELAALIEPEGDPQQERLLKELYVGARPDQRVGLTHVGMLMFRRVPERARRLNPEMGIIAILRDPVARAYSSFWAARLRGFEPSATFEEAIEVELSGRLRSDKDRIDRAHLEPGFYATQLERYRSVFEASQIFTLLIDDLAVDPAATLRPLLAWLGVRESVDELNLGRRHNETRAVKSMAIEAFLGTGAPSLRRVLRTLVPLRGRIWLRNRVMRRLRGWNRRGFTAPPMEAETRQRLREFYREDRARLEDLLDRDLSSWLL